MILRSIWVSLLLLAVGVCPAKAFAQASAGRQPPAQLTAEQDHQRMMELLHIPSLRRGADGDPKSANPANYDEAKAGPTAALPDPLLSKDGKKVTSAKMWWEKRRPEIVEDFDREIYGRVPAKPKVRWEVVSTAKEMNGDIPVITKKLSGHLDNSAYPLATVNIDLTLTTPANTDGPVPVMMEFSWTPEVMAALAKRFPEISAAAHAGPTWQQQVLAKGWGYAIYIPTSVQEDKGEGLTQGIIGLVNHGQPRKLDDWGALRAWAWGASRALDYFETDKSVDAKQVGIEGHSRYGKAALVAMAYDPRFAIAYISSSGEGGAKLFRRNFGEQIGERGGNGRVSLDGGEFSEVCGTADGKRFASGCARVDRAVCAASGVHWGGSDQWRWVGGCERNVSGSGGSGARLQAARQEGSGYDGVSCD